MKLSYANVAASLALFIALGGTAVAAASLAPDSVGSPQIRADAVRSAEIRADAVRSPEIAKDAVRGSEIRDASVLLADIAPDARTALGTNVRVAKKDFVEVPVCVGEDLTTCPDVLKRTLSPGDWLIEARLGVSSPDGSGSFPNRCGLVTQANTTGPLEFDDPGASQPLGNVQTEVIDNLRIGALGKDNQVEAIALSGVLDGAVGEPTVAVRCNVQQFDELDAEDVKITAQKVGSIVGE
jgi:hypothetical protein